MDQYLKYMLEKTKIENKWIYINIHKYIYNYI